MLKTDYKNDVLDTSVNDNRKYEMTNNSDGTISLTDVTVYSQEGSLLGANDINATNERVNQLTAQDGLDFRFATDGEGNYGYLGADDSFIPFKNGEEPVLLWENRNPNTAFASGTRINLDLSPYSAVLIEIKAETTKDYRTNGLINYVPINNPSSGGGTALISQYIDGTNIRIRRLTAIDNNGITFGNGSQPYGTASNSYGIPTRIWGVPTQFNIVTSAIVRTIKETNKTTRVELGFKPQYIMLNKTNGTSSTAGTITTTYNNGVTNSIRTADRADYNAYVTLTVNDNGFTYTQSFTSTLTYLDFIVC